MTPEQMQVGNQIEVQDIGGMWHPATVLEVAEHGICVLVDWEWLTGTTWLSKARCRAIQAKFDCER